MIKMPDSNSSLTSSTTTSTSLPEAWSFYVPLRSLSAHVVAPASESTKKKEKKHRQSSSASKLTKKKERTLYSILNSPLPCVTPLN